MIKQYESALIILIFFFFNDTATPEIYPLPLPAALPICARPRRSPPAQRGRCGLDLWLSEPGDPGDPTGVPGDGGGRRVSRSAGAAPPGVPDARGRDRDRKSTRLNSSHSQISYAVFCLKK